MFPITFLPEVQPEVDATYWWYETEQSGLGEEFLEAVDECLEAIREFPDGPAPLLKDVRVRCVGRFPYGIYYRIQGAAVVVIAIVHLHRHSRAWRARLKS